MSIIQENPDKARYLVNIMTDEDLIKSKTYREEVQELLNAKTDIKINAMEEFIRTKQNDYMLISSHYNNDNTPDINEYKRKNKEDYLRLLRSFNNIPDKYISKYLSLLLNNRFLESPYKDFDIQVLKEVSSIDTFTTLCYISVKENFINSPYHKEDYCIISKTKDPNKLSIMERVATDNYSIRNKNHSYDMRYLYNLDVDSIDPYLLDEVKFYMLDNNGISSKEHTKSLESLKEGNLVERKNTLYDYLIDLLNNKEKLPEKEKQKRLFMRRHE